jgi:hypothetical protein
LSFVSNLLCFRFQCDQLTDGGMGRRLPLLSRLTELHLGYCPHLSNASLCTLACRLPRLTHLSIDKWAVTDAGTRTHPYVGHQSGSVGLMPSSLPVSGFPSC